MSKFLGHMEADSLIPVSSLVNYMCSMSTMINTMSERRRTENEMMGFVSRAIKAMTDLVIEGNRVSLLPLLANTLDTGSKCASAENSATVAF